MRRKALARWRSHAPGWLPIIWRVNLFPSKLPQLFPYNPAFTQRKQAELQAIEEKRAQVKKLDAQIEIRADLDRFNKEKIRQRAQEIKASLEMDLSIVNDFFKADEKERALKNRKREEARKEMILYREHLKEMKRVEEERERELEKLYQEEEEKVNSFCRLMIRSSFNLLS